MLGRLAQDPGALLDQRPALVAGLDAGLERDPVGRGAGRVAPWVAERAAAELEHRVVAEDLDQVGHVVDVDATGGNRHHRRQRDPGLVEVEATRRIGRHVVEPQQVDHTER